MSGRPAAPPGPSAEERRGGFPVFVNFALHAAAKNLHLLLTMVVLAFVSRRDGREGMGLYLTVTSLYTLFLTFAPLGLAPLVTREVARDRSRAGEVLATGLGFALPLGLLATGGMNLASRLGYPPDVVEGCRTIGLALLVSVGAEYAEATLIGLERMAISSLVGIVENFLRTALSLFLLFSGHPVSDLFWLHPILRGASFLALLVLCAAAVPARTWRPRRESFQILLRGTGVLSLTIVAVSLSWRLDETILPLFVDQGTAGDYLAARRILNIAIGVAGSAILAIYPRMARLFLSDREGFRAYVERSALAMFVLSLLPAVVLTVAPGLAIDPIFGSKMQGAHAVLAVGIWLLPVGVLSGTYGRVFLAANRLRADLLSNVVALVATAALLPLGTASLSIAGAAAAYVVARAATLAFQVLAVARPGGLVLSVEGRSLRALGAIAAASIGAGALARPLGAACAGAAGAIAFALLVHASPLRGIVAAILPGNRRTWLRRLRAGGAALAAACGLLTVVPVALLLRALLVPFRIRTSAAAGPPPGPGAAGTGGTDLLDLLPLGRGARVLVEGENLAPLLPALRERAGSVRVAKGDSRAAEEEPFDAVLLDGASALASAKARLKPGGWICVRSENPLALRRLLGGADEGEVRYASLLPAPLGRSVSWLLGGTSHSREAGERASEARLAREGFGEIRILGLAPDARNAKWIVPLEPDGVERWALASGLFRSEFRGLERRALRLLPPRLLPRLLGGYAILARRTT